MLELLLRRDLPAGLWRKTFVKDNLKTILSVSVVLVGMLCWTILMFRVVTDPG